MLPSLHPRWDTSRNLLPYQTHPTQRRAPGPTCWHTASGTPRRSRRCPLCASGSRTMQKHPSAPAPESSPSWPPCRALAAAHPGCLSSGRDCRLFDARPPSPKPAQFQACPEGGSRSWSIQSRSALAPGGCPASKNHRPAIRQRPVKHSCPMWSAIACGASRFCIRPTCFRGSEQRPRRPEQRHAEVRQRRLRNNARPCRAAAAVALYTRPEARLAFQLSNAGEESDLAASALALVAGVFAAFPTEP